MHAIWRPVPGRFKDYVALPKANGYQSLHTTVIGPYGERMEVQIRTSAMHRDAELGIAAHWKYKSGKLDADADDSKFAWLRQLVERHRDLTDPNEFIETVKIDLFPDEVFVFTPRGDVIGLPVGATPVDFAYAIHSEVGDSCAGAKINGKLVSLRHKLVDGDTVEILTHARQLPRKDWLDFVVTGKARSKIRHAIRAEEKARSRELGRELLDREFRKAGLSLPRALEGGGHRSSSRSATAAARSTTCSRRWATAGSRRPSLVRELQGSAAPPEPEPAPRRRLFGRAEGAASSGLQVGGQSDVMVRFGGCCAPLPGDEVVGFVTRGRGVTVHLKDCPKVFELDPERRIDVDWQPDAGTRSTRKIRMRVRSQDQPGLLAKVTKTISAEGVNIGAAIVTTSPDRLSEQTFDVWVPDVAKLNAVMKEIRKIKGVLSVERLRGDSPARSSSSRATGSGPGPPRRCSSSPPRSATRVTRSRSRARPRRPRASRRCARARARRASRPCSSSSARAACARCATAPTPRGCARCSRERAFDVVHTWHTRDHVLALRARGARCAARGAHARRALVQARRADPGLAVEPLAVRARQRRARVRVAGGGRREPAAARRAAGARRSTARSISRASRPRRPTRRCASRSGSRPSTA